MSFAAKMVVATAINAVAGGPTRFYRGSGSR